MSWLKYDVLVATCVLFSVQGIAAQAPSHTGLMSCLTVEPVGPEVLRELPKSWRRQTDSDVLGVRGHRILLPDPKCWRNARGLSSRFDPSAMAAVYLRPEVVIAGLCRSTIESHSFEKGHWGESQGWPFAVALSGGSDCAGVTLERLVNVRWPIEDFSVKALLAAEPALFAAYEKMATHPERRTALHAIDLRVEDVRVLYSLQYELGECRTLELYVSGTVSGGLQLVRDGMTIC